jgi:hypothetical protein
MMNSSNKNKASQEWEKKAKLMTFSEAVLAQIDSLGVSSSKKELMRTRWMQSDPNTFSNAKARQVADYIFGRKNSVYFDWDLCRVREGYFQLRAGIGRFEQSIINVSYQNEFNEVFPSF